MVEQGTRAQQDQSLQNQIVVEQGTRAQQDQYLQNQIVVEQGTRAQQDQYLYNLILLFGGSAAGSVIDLSGSLATETSNRIAGDNLLSQQINNVLGGALQGTISVYTASIRYGRPDTAFTFINGVVASRTESKFSWEDFDSYGTTTGTEPYSGTMSQGSSWNGNGIIYTNSLVIGVTGTDWMNVYPTGTVTSNSLDQGTGWASTGSFWGDAYWFHAFGTDTFETYALGTLSDSGSEINGGGGGWVGTAVCYQGSNRP